MIDSAHGWAAALMTLGLLTLPSPALAQNRVPEPAASQWGSGKNLYDKVCGHCHAPEVGVGTQIQGRDLPVDYVRFIVRNGINGMPAFPASYIDDASIAQVTEYIASLPAPAAQP